MQYYVNFNEEDGNISGFYVDEINGDNFPQTAVAITLEQWQAYSAAANLYKLSDNPADDEGPARLKTQAELDAEAAAQPPRPESDAEKIARLQAEKAALEAQVTQLNSDFAGFIDFYFAQNPDQA